MGYSGGLYRAPKFNGKLDMKAKDFAKAFDDYSRNEWAQKNFSNKFDYAKNYCCDVFEPEETKDEVPSQEAIDFYLTKVHDGEYGKVISDEIVYFGSLSTKYIHNWFEQNDLVDKEIPKEKIYEFVSHCLECLEEFYPESCVVNNAFRKVKSENGYEDENEIRLIPCDGIEVTFDEDGSNKRIYTSDESRAWGCVFYANRVEKDFDDSLCLRESLKELIKVLATMDFDKEAIYYNGGW